MRYPLVILACRARYPAREQGISSKRATAQTAACDQPKVRAMGSRSNQGQRGSINSARFEALLDKLVAVQMDLEPVCGIGKHRTQVISPFVTIAEACDTLRSALADIRNIIGQVDGLMDEPDAFADENNARRPVVY